MAKPIDKLLKLLAEDRIADTLDEDQQQKIVDDVLEGYKIDEDSRQSWLETNQEAMRIIKHCEEDTDEDTLDTPVYKVAKVIYPLIAPAVIQLASRMIVHIVRNDRIVEMAVLGKDEQVPEDPAAAQAFQQFQEQMQQMAPQLQQLEQQNPDQAKQIADQIQQNAPKPPVMIWKKKDRAERTSKYMNYKFLMQSKTWLKDMHKVCSITASWGTSFIQVYYDPIKDEICHDLIPPEDVIINHKITSLEKAPRITIRHYMTVNDILSQIRGGYFSEIDLDVLKTQADDKVNPKETLQPASIVYCQYMYLDLDEDGYQEPYKVYVHAGLQKLLGIFPAFDADDIKIDPKNGKVIRVKRQLDIVDDHLIDDPEGGFYSLGLNYLLLHQNKSITSVLRQLLDAGLMKNAASCTGFITNAFKTRERNLEFTLGTYKTVDVNPTVDPRQHIIPLPATEPSQVLVGLLQMLIEGGEKTGFITDALTGDMSGQNVPATTMLAMIEQGTRAFKPVIQKFWIARKSQFQLDFKLRGKHLNEEEYFAFQDTVVKIGKEDFQDKDIDICPVADPTQSSEGHRFAKLQFIIQAAATQLAPGMNIQENLRELYKGMEFDEPDRFVAQPQPPPPDPKMLKVQLDAKNAEANNQLQQQKLMVEAQHKADRNELERLKQENSNLMAQATVMSMDAQKQQAYAQAKKTLEESKTVLPDLHLRAEEVEIKRQEAQAAKIAANKNPSSS